MENWIAPLIGVPIGLLVVFLGARAITRRASKTANALGAERPNAATFLIAPFPAWTRAMNELRAQDGLGKVRVAGWTRVILSVDPAHLEIHSAKGKALLSRPASAVTGIDTGTLKAGLNTVQVINIRFGGVTLPVVVYDASAPFTSPVTNTQHVGGLIAGALWPGR